MRAVKDILPYAVLFYAIDVFIWWNGRPSSPSVPTEFNDRGLIQNILFSSLFLAGFFVIDFFRARGRQKQAQMAPAQVYVVQQPVYMPPPGYALTPIPPQGQGALPPQPPLPPPPGAYYPPYPEQQPPARSPDPRKRPPEGSA